MVLQFNARKFVNASILLSIIEGKPHLNLISGKKLLHTQKRLKMNMNKVSLFVLKKFCIFRMPTFEESHCSDKFIRLFIDNLFKRNKASKSAKNKFVWRLRVIRNISTNNQNRNSASLRIPWCEIFIATVNHMISHCFPPWHDVTIQRIFLPVKISFSLIF